MERPTVLVLDRDTATRQAVCRAFETRGGEAIGVGDASAALEVLRTRSPTVLAVDPAAPGVVATDLLASARRLRPAVAIVVLSDGSGADSRLRADVDVFDTVTRDTSAQRLARMARRGLAHGQALDECRRLRDRLRSRLGQDALLGSSAAVERLREQLQKETTRSEPVTLVGEAGSGRESAARTLHAGSRTADAPFVRIRCRQEGSAGLVAGLFDDRRVTFLDDLLALPEAAQAALVEALVRRDGAARVRASTRLLCACTTDPREAVEEGRLLPDLCDRVAAVTIVVPPLRDRTEDVTLLATHYIEELRELNGLPPIRLGAEAAALLESHPWPGNVRELRSAIEQAVIVAGEGEIEPGHLPAAIRQAEGRGSAGTARAGRFREAKKDVVDDFERRYLRALLERHRGNVTAAAAEAGMLRSALQRLLRKHAIRSADFRRRDVAAD